jgi:hypothetical protein
VLLLNSRPYRWAGALPELFPQELERLIGTDAARAWAQIRPFLPPGTYLAGGTAIAIRLAHRSSRDLDFFTSQKLEVEALLDDLTESDLQFATLRVMPRAGSLGIVIGSTHLEFSDASMTSLTEPTEVVAGIAVAGLGDLMAMKLSAITKRKQLRDYEDLRAIEQVGGRRVEEGLALFAERYEVPDEAGLLAVIEALGAIDRCPEDPLVIMPRGLLMSYWHRRLPEIIAALSRWEVPRLSPDLASAVLARLASQREMQLDLSRGRDHGHGGPGIGR